MYHQVCERKNDPWELAVHPNHFHGQLEYLSKNFNVVSIGTLASGIAANNTNAAPLLDWHELPATFYVATTALKEQKIYWWDELLDIVLQREVLPASLEIEISHEWVRFDFTSDRILNQRLINQIHAWNCNLPIPNERIALYMLLWRRLKPLAHQDQKKVLKQIKEWSGAVEMKSGQ